jgi:hypothetical protein
MAVFSHPDTAAFPNLARFAREPFPDRRLPS